MITSRTLTIMARGQCRGHTWHAAGRGDFINRLIYWIVVFIHWILFRFWVYSESPMPPVRCHQHWSVHSYSDRMLRGLGQLGQAPGGRINYQLSDGCCRAAQLTAHQRWWWSHHNLYLHIPGPRRIYSPCLGPPQRQISLNWIEIMTIIHSVSTRQINNLLDRNKVYIKFKRN